MNKIFLKKLYKRLSAKVKGHISLTIISDTLVVDIQLNPYTVPFHYTVKGIYCQLSAGTTSKIMADVIISEYKKQILKSYFK